MRRKRQKTKSCHPVCNVSRESYISCLTVKQAETTKKKKKRKNFEMKRKEKKCCVM